MRPIVSFVGSSTYELSRYLCSILAPITGNNGYSIKNTSEWIGRAKSLKLQKDEELVSFDVVSLFTSIPTSLAIEVAKSRLETDPSLKDRTDLQPTDIIDLLSFCLNSTQFQFRDNYYQQIHGTAMGSPVSVDVANMVMEYLESKALSSFHHCPSVYCRFVDDTIVAIKKNFNHFIFFLVDFLEFLDFFPFKMFCRLVAVIFRSMGYQGYQGFFVHQI